VKKILVIILIPVFCVNLVAQSDQDRGHHPRDGFFASMSFGAYYESINDDIIGGEYSNMQMKGYGGGANIKLGAAITENFILHGTIFTRTSGSMNVVADGTPIGTIMGENDIDTRMFGLGVTYYIMPANIFLSGSIGLNNFELTDNEVVTTTPMGPGLYLELGKEWWISKNWDLGFNISLSYGGVDNESDTMSEALSGITLGVGFNATFN